MDTDDDWRFYKAKNFERPSAQELKDVKGIIISYSCYKIKNKVAKDESLIKQLAKKAPGDEMNKSENGRDSSLGSIDQFDTDIYIK